MRRFLLYTISALALTTSVAAADFTPAMDYSFVGYRLSAERIPAVQAKVTVVWREGDQWERIQKAIDYVSNLPADKSTGLRGAVILDAGTYTISRPLRLRQSGVVLRGSGAGRTVIEKQGVDRGAVVYIESTKNASYTDTLSISQLKKGDKVLLVRPSTKEWIAQLHTDNFGGGQKLGYWGWRPGEIDVMFSRTITGDVIGETADFDVPLPVPFSKEWTILRDDVTRLVHDSGVEMLTISAAVDAQKALDEDHAWDGVYIAGAQDCWVRQVDFHRLAGSAVVVQRDGRQITVEDCRSFEPVSEIGGYRRRTFLTLGERCLFQRLYSEQGINDFSTGMLAAGPNVFSQCDAYDSRGFSGSTGSYSTGLLLDNVNIDGGDICLNNIGLEKYGQGYVAANSTAYQSTAAAIKADTLPDGMQNYVYGCWGQFEGTAQFGQPNEHVKPWSLFHQQLKARVGDVADAITRTYERDVNASSSPTIEVAQRMSKEALLPRMTMKEWVLQADSIVTEGTSKTVAVDAIKQKTPAKSAKKHDFIVKNGKLLIDDELLMGERQNSPWWNGRVRYSDMAKRPDAVTRFVPGMEMQGGTDRIDSVVQHMVDKGVVLYAQNYGLWYDRRRDDHERVRRSDGDVWPPFYEQPFSRSGQQSAWDGLSKYDLTELNPYYIYRLRDFASLAAQSGIVLVNKHYFQHNILEAGAHWVDCPWRTANNINESGFLEPVPFTGDKRIFTAEAFYDTTHVQRVALHRQYIAKMLDAFSDQPNVIHSLSEEYTGTKAFTELWLDAVRDWQAVHGKRNLIALNATKDVVDAVMSQPSFADVVDIIDIEQWFYHSKGEFAPPGGANLAPRQHQRLTKPSAVSFDDAYRTVAECVAKYPTKAVIYSGKSYPEMAWAVLMAGGSVPSLKIDDAALRKSLASMKPQISAPSQDGMAPKYYSMANDRGDMIVYIDDADSEVALPGDARYTLMKVERDKGAVTKIGTSRKGDAVFKSESKGIYWLIRQ